MRRLPIQSRTRYSYRALCILIVALISLHGCGGGGGGGEDFIGAANVRITASPNRIDTGDRTLVKISIRDVHENGIALKVRFPVGLVYVRDSAVLTVGNSQVDAGPLNNVAPGDQIYLVYYFSRDIFGKEEHGDLRFELEATGEITDGQIEVDADVDDPLIDNEDEFDATAPEFLAESSASLVVVD